MIEESRPIFQQIADRIAAGILSGDFAEETQVSSTNEFAAFYRINPATAGKGINLLVDDGILYKKRGVGMFVAPGAREVLLAQRREAFERAYVNPLVHEAHALGLTASDITAMIEKEYGR